MSERQDGLNVPGTESERTAAWLAVFNETFNSLHQAQALAGLGVKDGSGRDDVRVALGRMGMLEHCCPVSLRTDPKIVSSFEALNKLSVSRTGQRLAAIRSAGVE